MTAKPTPVVIHGHLYQPPREDPATGEVPADPTAAPYHDWNRRVHDECYRPLVAARILDGQGRIAGTVCGPEWMSWDAGPTLLRWLAREAPETYRGLLDADARSRSRLGSGNALASPYHHVILPLASRRDKVTEVRWGIADFERRFGRRPEGLWLPETAVDTETLDVLAGEGILFTVLAPHQVESPPPGGAPGRVQLPGGRSLAVFVYDGPLSHDVAFGALLKDSAEWHDGILAEAAAPGRALVSMATDAETFGHHHRWGDLALARVLSSVGRHERLRLENFATFLAREPATHDVTLVEPSSWSCTHGVERWRANCGCKAAPERRSQQRWRAGLRDALEELAASLDGLYGAEAGALFDDPWGVRDAFGAVVDASDATRRAFVEERRVGDAPAGVERALELLELQRHTLGMFTSCGWFFDDIGGVEPVQVLRYAARAIDLAGRPADEWEARLERRLSRAKSNDRRVGDGGRLWRDGVRGGRTPPLPSLEPDEAAAAAVTTEPDPREAAAAQELIHAVRRLAHSPGPESAREVERIRSRAGSAADSVLPEVQALFAASRPWLGSAPGEEVRGAAESLGFAPSIFEAPPLGGRAPLALVLGVHLHQPVGNFDHVFETHTTRVYRPFLERVAGRGLLPLTLHVSGPLLEWLEARNHPLLDLIGRLAANGDLELLMSGFYEPVLTALSRDDRREQLAWMREWLRSRFGVTVRGLWLTERVWEQDLADDLTLEGVRHALLDDRHFLVSGFEPNELGRPYHAEGEGGALALLPIDEHLRYLVPFRPATEIAAYLRELRALDRPLAVLVDDGEKFGGWPGTQEWVWESGWLETFLDAMEDLTSRGEVRLVSSGEAAAGVASGGPAYLPTGSYREMEGWALPPAAAARLEVLDTEARARHGPEAGHHVRGGHWRNFLARYEESGRMHRKARALSRLCRERGDPETARRAIGRAQCNDAYWHGVFGGLYLRHLRGAVWANLAEAERLMRQDEGLEAELVDMDGYGRPDVWVHSSAFSAVVSPSQGGALTELTRFATGANLADTLTRRREAYHRAAPEEVPEHTEPDDEGMPSIHALEAELGFGELPPFDRDVRALFVDRVLPAELTEAAYRAVDYDPLRSWADDRMKVEVSVDTDEVVVAMRSSGPDALEKRISFAPDGSLEVLYRWDPVGLPPGARFAPELSLAHDLDLELEPGPRAVWRYEIRTVSKSEAGAEESVQGVSVTPQWRCDVGWARLALTP